MAISTKIKKDEENALLKSGTIRQQAGVPSIGNTEYGSPYTALLTKTMDSITNREPFKFDLNGDALYQQYRQKYLRDAQLAAQDTMGMTTALTGGYANSYAQSAAQQAYQNQIAKLNDVVPDIYQIQRGAYDADTENLYRQYELYANADNAAYGRYRDVLNDERYDTEWQHQLDRENVEDERYNKEWDYQTAQDERNWNYQLERDRYQDDLNRANVLMETGQYDAAGQILGIDLSGYQTEFDKKKALDAAFEQAQREWTLKGYEQDYTAGEISNNSAKLNYALKMAELGNYDLLRELGISPEQYQSYLAAASAGSSSGGGRRKQSGGGDDEETWGAYSTKKVGKSKADGPYTREIDKDLKKLYSSENGGNLTPQGTDSNGNIIARDRATNKQYVIKVNAYTNDIRIYDKETMKEVTNEFFG